MKGKDGESIIDQPPSAKLVYIVLEQKGPMTQKKLIEESLLPGRTVRYALKQLEDAGLLEEEFHFADGRQKLYRLIDDDPVQDTSLPYGHQQN